MLTRTIRWLALPLLMLLSQVGHADNVPHRTFEVRTYTVARDEIRTLHELFAAHSGRFFIKYGIQVIAFWTPQSEEVDEGSDGTAQLICVLAHPDPDQAREAWQQFSADKKWRQRVIESGLDASILDQARVEYFDPSYYSPLK